MGAWGVGIFEDDVACDARDRFYDLLREETSLHDATDQILDEMSEELDDEEDGPVVILALANAQFDAGRLDPRIKSRALNLIKSGVDTRWKETEQQELRLKVLGALEAKLISTPPPPADIDELGD